MEADISILIWDCFSRSGWWFYWLWLLGPYFLEWRRIWVAFRTGMKTCSSSSVSISVRWVISAWIRSDSMFRSDEQKLRLFSPRVFKYNYWIILCCNFVFPMFWKTSSGCPLTVVCVCVSGWARSSSSPPISASVLFPQLNSSSLRGNCLCEYTHTLTHSLEFGIESCSSFKKN